MSGDLALRVQNAYDRCKNLPEAGVRDGMFQIRGDAYLALIELRNLAPEIVLALGQADGSHRVLAKFSRESWSIDLDSAAAPFRCSKCGSSPSFIGPMERLSPRRRPGRGVWIGGNVVELEVSREGVESRVLRAVERKAEPLAV